MAVFVKEVQVEPLVTIIFEVNFVLLETIILAVKQSAIVQLKVVAKLLRV